MNVWINRVVAVLLLSLLSVSLAFSTERMSADITALLSQGPRIAGTPSANAASEYLAFEFRKAGYTVEFQTFSYSRTRDQGSLLSVGAATLEANAIVGSPSRKVEADLIPVLGVGNAADYAGLEVRGKVVVVRRGTIPFLEKARQAAERGAVGMIVVNNAPGIIRGSFGGGAGPLPSVFVTQEQGERLFAQTAAKVSLEVRIVDEQVQGRNVVAHRGTVAPDLVVGGHYDSVPGAPGANDNASGSVTTLELARQVANTPLGQRTWFVLFDAEEDGLWGSRRFVEQNPALVRGLKGMLNLDMVGVKISQTLGIGGDSKLFELSKAVEPSVFSMGASNGSSDHAPFASAGVPVLFFHWGIDPNYHQPGDTTYDPALMAQTGQVVRGVMERILVQ